jgi:hypothetical protein
MSIRRRTNIDRLTDARKSSRPTIGKGKPLDGRGDDGDLTFRRTSDGLKLYIKANGKWHGIKVGESFDDLEKILKDLKTKVARIKTNNLPRTYTTQGDFTLDASGDIELNADGGNVVFKDASTELAQISTNGLSVPAAQKLYFDGEGGHTYLHEISNDNFDLVVGGDLFICFNEFGSAGNYVRFNPGVCVGMNQQEPTFDATDTDVDFRQSNKAKLTLTADITDIHFQFPVMSGNFLCVLLQDGTGGWDITNWKTKDGVGNAGAGNSGLVLWAGGTAPPLTETADKADIVSIYWDSDNEIAYGVVSNNF